MPKQPSREIIAANVRRLRLDYGWTLDELGARLGGKPSSRIAEIEAGRNAFTSGTLDDLADALGVNPAALLMPVEAPVAAK